MRDSYKELEARFYRLSGLLGGCCSRIKLAAQRGDTATEEAERLKRELLEAELKEARVQLNRASFSR